MAFGTIGVFATTDVTPDYWTPTPGLVANGVKSLPGNSYNSPRGGISVPVHRRGKGRRAGGAIDSKEVRGMRQLEPGRWASWFGLVLVLLPALVGEAGRARAQSPARDSA